MSKICDATLRYDVAEASSAQCIDCPARWAKSVDTHTGVITHVEQTSHTVIVDTNHRELWGMA